MVEQKKTSPLFLFGVTFMIICYAWSFRPMEGRDKGPKQLPPRRFSVDSPIDGQDTTSPNNTSKWDDHGRHGKSDRIEQLDVKKRKMRLKTNIEVAVFTCPAYWLFRKKLDQRTPLVYKCPNTRKTLSVRSAYLNATMVRDADVVIFSRSIDYRLWDQVYAHRSPHQVWVYGSAESAYKSPQVMKADTPVGFGDFRFNMSFSYVSTSDVVAPFGEYLPFRDADGATRLHFNSTQLRRPKDKLIAWISSHCDNQQWNRTGFVHALSELISVDKFGKCGDQPQVFLAGAPAVISSYKFYLALENSCCLEYITEKLWESLARYEAVPIVVGARKEEYERVAPPDSFIYADDFESMEDLAAYLRRVSNDDELYGKFHQWRLRGIAKLYKSERVYAFNTQWTACALLDFLEENAWKESKPLGMSFDPYGKEWLGSCRVCGERPMLKSLDLNSNAYRPTSRPHAFLPEYKLKSELDEHRRKIADQYMERMARASN